MGDLLKRQSDKHLPQTSFQKGVQEGKVMAHEMAGVILVISLSLRMSQGRHAVKNKATGDAKENFKTKRQVMD